MKRALLFACIAICAPLFSQQGHPLTGTWSGDWGTTSTQRHQVTFVMNWDGKNVTGLINPGPDSMPIASVFVDPATWTVRIEANGKEHISAEGKIENLGSYHRSIKGSWTQGTAKGDFRITRD
jgi:hypothetical protein